MAPPRQERRRASKTLFASALSSFIILLRQVTDFKNSGLSSSFGTGRSEYLISNDLNAPSDLLLDLELRTLVSFHPPWGNCNIMQQRLIWHTKYTRLL